MHRTRSTVLVTAAAAVAAAVTAVVPAMSGTAVAATSTDPARVGLYGSQDPTFDGVYRQSLSLLALAAAGRAPARSAVAWLLAEQCADGGFQSFRAKPGQPCAKPSSSTFSGEDVNSTGIAVQALHAVGHDAAAMKALAWLTGHQSADGGWAYYPDGAAGNDPDANSSALGLSAYLALGRTPPSPGGVSPYDALLGMQVGCAGAVDDRGAFTFSATANDYATVQAALAVGGGFLPVAAHAGANDAPAATCPGPAWTAAQSADYAAGYLVRRMTANGHVVPDPFNPGQTDYGTTANAVIALVATGHGSAEATAALAVLAAHQSAFTVKSGADLPGALGTLVLAAVAGGENPSAFGGSDLTARLAATLTTASPTPPNSPSPTPTPTPTTAPVVARSSGGSMPATGDARPAAASVAGALLVAAGSALVLVARRRRTAQVHRR
jgi:LPXTG-motif cell wall-anchored protein